MNPFLQLLIKELPDVVAEIRMRYGAINPALPPLTDEEALALLKQAVDSSVAKDDNWLRAHNS